MGAQGCSAVKSVKRLNRGNKMLAKVKLNGKILGAIVLTLCLTSAVSFWMT
jgi:hypothetical protein